MRICLPPGAVGVGEFSVPLELSEGAFQQALDTPLGVGGSSSVPSQPRPARQSLPMEPGSWGGEGTWKRWALDELPGFHWQRRLPTSITTSRSDGYLSRGPDS